MRPELWTVEIKVLSKNIQLSLKALMTLLNTSMVNTSIIKAVVINLVHCCGLHCTAFVICQGYKWKRRPFMIWFFPDSSLIAITKLKQYPVSRHQFKAESKALPRPRWHKQTAPLMMDSVEMTHRGGKKMTEKKKKFRKRNSQQKKANRKEMELRGGVQCFFFPFFLGWYKEPSVFSSKCSHQVNINKYVWRGRGRPGESEGSC